MNVPQEDLVKILDKLKEANCKRYEQWEKESNPEIADSLRQVIFPAESLNAEIPSLDKEMVYPLSPMLKARFKYAGRWSNAIYGTTFYSLSEMQENLSDPLVIDQVRIRKEYWETSPPAVHPWSKISLFGANTQECEEVYLVWQNFQEPKIASYISNVEYWFDSLGDFLLFYTRIH